MTYVGSFYAFNMCFKLKSYIKVQNKLENVAIANALQLEAARDTPALCRFN